MRQPLPWGRLAAEAVVVIVSILLAFAIDAYWGNRQLRQEELQLLRGLEQELQEGKTVISAFSADTHRARERLQRFLSAAPAEVGDLAGPDAWEEVYLPLVRQWVGSIPRGALDAATGSGQLALISDPALRAALARLESLHANVDEIHRLVSELDVRTAAILGEWDGVYYEPSEDRGIQPEILGNWRADPRVRGSASAKYGFTGGYLTLLRQLEDSMDETLVLIRGELAN